jgi:UPF0755 protein
MKDEHNIDSEHQKKVQNFRIHIDDADLAEDTPETIISSYSNPAEAQKRRERSEAVATGRAQLAHELRNEEKARKNRTFFRLMWFCFVLMASLLAAKYLVSGINDMLAVGRQSVNVTVELPKNATSDQVTQILAKSGAIRDGNFFKLFSKLTKAPKTYGGGSYQITTGMDYEAIINSIQSKENRVDTVKITFTEGMNAPEVAAKLEKNGVCSAKDALSAFNTTKLDDDYDLVAAIQNNSARYYRLEGYLFPDTYEFFKNEDTADVVEKMVSNCNKKLTKQIRDKAKEEGMTVDQMITLASMIQAEAADKDDMYQVSSVFHNRLTSKDNSLLHLDSDPTTFYPYRQKSLVPANIRNTYKSKYDTYTVKGLPAGAICNPGDDAIDAALNPADTSYYYFCHDKNRKAYYATTLARHEENLKEAGLK